jgi:hypothetical protein
MELVYRAFGLTLGSGIALPGLPAGTGDPDVRIRRMKVPDWPEDATIRYGERCRIRNQEWWVRFKALAFRALIRDGNLIQFESDPSQDELTGLHILGSCTGAMLFQRGLVAIHGNTVVTKYGAVTVAGNIRAGKSATTMALLQRGHRLLADDITAVSCEAGEPPRILPGFPRVKLWKVTLDHFGRDSAKLYRLRTGLDKFHYPVDDLFCASPQPSAAIYILNPSDVPAVRVRNLTGLAKLDALRPHLYKLRFHDAVRNWPQLMGKVCRLADSVRVSIVERPRDGMTIDAVADAIEKDLSDCLRKTVARA